MLNNVMPLQFCKHFPLHKYQCGDFLNIEFIVALVAFHTTVLDVVDVVQIAHILGFCLCDMFRFELEMPWAKHSFYS